MARRKKDNIEVEEVKDLNMDSNKVQESKITEDNPFSKKVTSLIDKVDYNKNNEILNDSDLIGNVIL